MEKKLSASQRDAILLGEALNDTALRREIADAMKSSNEALADALKTLSE